VVLFGIQSYVLPSPLETLAALYQNGYALAVHGAATLITTLLGS
jgi:ABC-type nitrate/sulfonate/bicarbonate transport system permease component